MPEPEGYAGLLRQSVERVIVTQFVRGLVVVILVVVLGDVRGVIVRLPDEAATGVHEHSGNADTCKGKLIRAEIEALSRRLIRRNGQSFRVSGFGEVTDQLAALRTDADDIGCFAVEV